MVSRITVRTRNGEYPGELDDSDISNAIWLSNRLTVEINMLGGMMYGELPLDVILPKENRTTELDAQRSWRPATSHTGPDRAHSAYSSVRRP